MIVWCDLETSGLDPKRDHILEVGLIVTDDTGAEGRSMSLCVLPVGMSIEQLIAQTDPYVVAMHSKNGLWADLQQEVPEGGPLLMRVPVYRRYEAEQAIFEWVVAAATDELEQAGSKKEPTQLLRYTPLAGNTIGFDRAFLKEHMPLFESLFSYRSLDVTALNEIALRLFPKIHGIRPEAVKGAAPAHRALPDLRNSLAQLEHYKKFMFVQKDVELTIDCGWCAGSGKVVHGTVDCAKCRGAGKVSV